MIKNPITGDILPKGWQVVKVDDLKSGEKHACVAGPFGSDISSKYFQESGVPVIRGNNLSLSGKKFIPKDFAFVSEHRAKKYKGQHVKSDDLIFTCWGTLGQVGIIPSDGPFDEYIISNKQLKLRVDPKRVNPTYLYYYFSTAAVINYINNIAIGAAVPGINLGILKNFPVVLPPKDEQDLIAKILEFYFDLIDNNNQRIQLLEEMAEEIYKEWFVRMRFPATAGRPGYQDCQFFDKEGKEVPHGTKGALPLGWEMKRLSEVFEFISRGVTPVYKEDSYLFAINQKVNKGSFLDKKYLKSLDPDSGIPKAKYAIGGDILLNSLGEGTLGRVHYYMDNDHRYPIDQHMSILRTSSLPISLFVYLYLKSSLGQGRLDLMKVGGTNMTMLNLSDLKKFKLPISTEELMNKFYERVNNNLILKQNLIYKNQVLQETRDLLLPRLISGKLDVSELAINEVTPSNLVNGQSTLVNKSEDMN